MHIALAGDLPSARDRSLDAVDELELRRWAGCLVDPMRHHDARDAERRRSAPTAGDVVHPTADHRRAAVRGGFLEHLAVRSDLLEVSRRVVGPRPAEDPVVQDLAVLTEATTWDVVGRGHIAVEGHRDVEHDLTHGTSISLSYRRAGDAGIIDLLRVSKDDDVELNDVLRRGHHV